MGIIAFEGTLVTRLLACSSKVVLPPTDLYGKEKKYTHNIFSEGALQLFLGTSCSKSVNQCALHGY